jgi:hypothetical protein
MDAEKAIADAKLVIVELLKYGFELRALLAFGKLLCSVWDTSFDVHSLKEIVQAFEIHSADYTNELAKAMLSIIGSRDQKTSIGDYDHLKKDMFEADTLEAFSAPAANIICAHKSKLAPETYPDFNFIGLKSKKAIYQNHHNKVAWITAFSILCKEVLE